MEKILHDYSLFVLQGHRVNEWMEGILPIFVNAKINQMNSKRDWSLWPQEFHEKLDPSDFAVLPQADPSAHTSTPTTPASSSPLPLTIMMPASDKWPHKMSLLTYISRPGGETAVFNPSSMRRVAIFWSGNPVSC